jgi:hypothetical protein
MGGLAGGEWPTRAVTVAGAATKMDGPAKGAAWSVTSAVEGAGAAGAGGTAGVSQSHFAHWQPGESLGGADWSDRVTGAFSPQQDIFAAPQCELEAAEQQDRFLATGDGEQHDFTAVMVSATRSLTGVAGVRTTVEHAQARTGATAPIAVETASSRQMSGRTFRTLDMRASYTWPTAAVNPIHYLIGKLGKKLW